MIVIGLTGSVGMGKTEVGKYFKKKKIRVFDCDEEVRKIYQEHKVINQIADKFPSVFLGGNINKIELTKIVFDNPKKLRKLEKILHHRLREVQSKWIRSRVREKDNIIVFDVPLLFESNNIKKYDIIIVVSCSNEIQEKRVLRRKSWTKERLEKTIKTQMSSEKKKKMANLIIKTDRGKRYLWEEITKILKFSNMISVRPNNLILREFK